MLAFFQAIALGWVLGQLVGTLVRRRARRRGIPVDPAEVVERWGLMGASFVALVAAGSKILSAC